jgi:tRNA-2-methylthio-N6-dimethylallyladenosine synthase
MNRKYDRNRYLGIIASLRESCPDIAVTTDLIVGFPGESEEDFQETLDLVETVRFDSAFTFLYSPRKGTPAYSSAEQVPNDVKHDRFDRLIEAIHRIQGEKSRLYQGTTVQVLAEGPSRTDAGRFTGRAESSKVVDFSGTPDVVGRIVPVRITDAGTFSLTGELVR